MQALGAVLMIIANLILYLSFGSLVTIRKGKPWSLTVTFVVGFFLYYALFAIVTLPIMLTYRPLSFLTKIWAVIVIAVLCLALIRNHKSLTIKLREILSIVREHKASAAVIAAVVLLQVILVTSSYTFTLDAAYYVANVSTSIQTDMINVYDPFTGAWQDHFELRYAFATYSVQDAVMCQLTNIAPLVWTKTVMSASVILMTNIIYVGVVRFFARGNARMAATMMVAVFWVNATFITIYTTATFLFTRTYEGKAIVGNIAIIALFYLFMRMVRGIETPGMFLCVFIICFGVASVSSTANMVIPAQLCVLFVPYIIRHRAWKLLPKLVISMVPELVMLLVYVLYVKGYFAIYTYPLP